MDFLKGREEVDVEESHLGGISPLTAARRSEGGAPLYPFAPLQLSEKASQTSNYPLKNSAITCEAQRLPRPQEKTSPISNQLTMLPSANAYYAG